MMTSPRKNSVPFIFFGAGEIAVGALTEMEQLGSIPALIVTAPDRPAGRGKSLTPSPVSSWAEARGIETRKPETIDELFLLELAEKKDSLNAPLFLVIDYGKI